MKQRWWLLVVPVLLAATLAIAPTTPSQAQMGPMMGPPLDQLSGDDFDRAFLAQMTTHHAAAVMLARPAVANASHQETKDLALSIITDQTKEIAQLRSWGKEWYGLDIPDPLGMMDQMAPGSPAMGMPGMGASQGMPMEPMKPMGDMPVMNDSSLANSLWQLAPNRLDAVFMTLMIPHHQSAIELAKLVPDRAAHQELKDLAQSIIQSQSVEITKMNGWLGSWYSL